MLKIALIIVLALGALLIFDLLFVGFSYNMLVPLKPIWKNR